MDKDTAKEKAQAGYEQTRGKVERAAGEIIDSDKLRGRGELHEQKGKLREGIANLKESVKAGVERTIGKLSHEPHKE
jgi:uncharacterized protein YjbJ (UPF0337 family)